MKKKGATKNQPQQLELTKPAEKVDVYSEKTVLKDVNYPLLVSYVKSYMLDKKVETAKKFTVGLFGENVEFVVGKMLPEVEEGTFLKVTNKTSIVLLEEKPQEKIESESISADIQLYGMDKSRDQLIRCIEKSLSNKLQSFGLSRIKGILVLAISGMGKSALINYTKAKLSHLNFKIYQSFNLLSRVVGGSEQMVKKIFKEAVESQPCVLVFEDLHLLFSKNKNENETILSALLVELENLKEETKVVVVGTSNLDRQLDTNIKRAGRFEKQIVLELPGHKQRQVLLQGMLNKIPNSLKGEDVHQLNLRMNGFSNGQIKQIIREAFLATEDSISKENIMTILKNFRPSGIKQLLTEVPEVKWSEIGGYEQVKQKIRQVIQWPLLFPDAYEKLGIQPLKGILLYGPPGCSKTMMAKAIATESKLNFLAVKGPELFSKYVGQSEKAVRNIFKRARACSPCVIFFDQIDALATQRSINTDVSERVLCQLLNEMDGIEGLKEVTIVAATNRPQILDKALMRPGRLDHLIYIPPPDEEARKQIFRINFHSNRNVISEMPLEQDKEAVSAKLAAQTKNYSGAELCLICREGAILALSEDIHCKIIKTEHFFKAKSKIRGRLTEMMINQYRSFEDNLRFF